MPKTPRLREWRERAALSQEELHTRSGVSRATIADLEAGNRGAQPRTIRKLAEALNVAPDELYGGEEHPLAEAPPSPEQPSFNGLLEEERRVSWEAAVDNARQLREGGHARLEELVEAWQTSRERGELRSARRRYKEEIEQLFNKAYAARNALTDILFPGNFPAEEDWEEVRAADSFYLSLIEVMRKAGFVIQEHKSEPPTVEEREAV